MDKPKTIHLSRKRMKYTAYQIGYFHGYFKVMYDEIMEGSRCKPKTCETKSIKDVFADLTA